MEAHSRFQAWKTAPKATASTAPSTMSTVRHRPVVTSLAIVTGSSPSRVSMTRSVPPSSETDAGACRTRFERPRERPIRSVSPSSGYSQALRPDAHRIAGDGKQRDEVALAAAQAEAVAGVQRPRGGACRGRFAGPSPATPDRRGAAGSPARGRAVPGERAEDHHLVGARARRRGRPPARRPRRPCRAGAARSSRRPRRGARAAPGRPSPCRRRRRRAGSRARRATPPRSRRRSRGRRRPAGQRHSGAASPPATTIAFTPTPFAGMTQIRFEGLRPSALSALARSPVALGVVPGG